MSVSRENIRAETSIVPTPEDKGLVMTIVVKAYDTGLIEVDHRVVTKEEGWTGAAELLMQKLNECHRQEAVRQKSRGGRS